jgi:hypothetical protein
MGGGECQMLFAISVLLYFCLVSGRGTWQYVWCWAKIRIEGLAMHGEAACVALCRVA